MEKESNFLRTGIKKKILFKYVLQFATKIQVNIIMYIIKGTVCNKRLIFDLKIIKLNKSHSGTPHKEEINWKLIAILKMNLLNKF